MAFGNRIAIDQPSIPAPFEHRPQRREQPPADGRGAGRNRINQHRHVPSRDHSHRTIAEERAGQMANRIRLTPQRGCRVSWQEIDPAKAVWTIPRERTKNDVEHQVDLSTQALAILRSLPFPDRGRQAKSAPDALLLPRSGLIFSTTGKHRSPASLRSSAVSMSAWRDCLRARGGSHQNLAHP